MAHSLHHEPRQKKESTDTMKTTISLGNIFRKTWFIALVGIGLLASSARLSQAQFFSTNDTLRVLSASGNAGDTAIVVSIYLRNVEPIGGFQLRVVYDSTLLQPNSRRFVNPTPGHRAYDFYNVGFYSADISEPGVVTFFAGPSIDTFVQISPGAGSIVDLLFNVRSTAPDQTTPIRLIDSGNDVNALTDTIGLNLIFPVLRDGNFTIGGGGPGPSNDPPTIAFIPAQQVMEGDLLTFQVNATDPDGDNITLSAQNLPANASFPTVQGTGSVSGTFSFTPSSTQGPANYTVTFTARDDSNATDQKSVNIEVLDRPENVLAVDVNTGGIPGKQGVLVPLILNSIQKIYGMQFDLSYDPALITVDSFVPTPALSGFEIYSNLGDSAGYLTLVTFSLSGDSIPIFNDTVLKVAVSIDTAANPGTTDLILSRGKASTSLNPNDPSEPLTTTGAEFTVDAFGNMNLDANGVDVSDAVIMVNYLLTGLTLEQRRLDVADVNRDSSIDVGDLVGIINIILGRPINAPTYYSTVLAKVQLQHDSLYAGQSANISLEADLEVAVAGVQAVIEYDPNQLSFPELNKTLRSSQMTLTYQDNKSGRLKLLMYSLGGKAIDVGTGSILTLKAQVSPNLGPDEKVYLKIGKLVLADTAAVVIPTGDQPALPTDFRLEQNYPNPFNANTTIRFEIPFSQSGESVRATMKIYNILGRKVRTLVDEALPPGRHQVIWDGKDDFGNQVASGMYFYRLTLPGFSESRKMTLLK